MRYSKQGLIAAVAATSAFALVGCSDSSGGTDEQAAAWYGDCQVYGEKGSISLNPVTEGVLTVQTNLPSPGWWKGTSPESIDGGYEYCLAANIAQLFDIPKG